MKANQTRMQAIRALRALSYGENISLATLILLGLTTRLLILPFNFQTPDLHTWFWTGLIANSKPGGLLNLYRYVRLYAYPPLWIFFCSVAYRMHPWYRLDQTSSMLIKLPIVVADLATGVLIYLIVKEPSGSRRALIAATLYIMNAHIVFVSSYWGMFDSLIALFLSASVYLLHRERTGWAGVLAGLSLLAKQNSIPLAIVLTFVTFKRGRAEGLRFLLAAATLFTVVSLPFLISTPGDFISALYYDKPLTTFRGRCGALWYTLRAFAQVPSWLEANHFYVFYVSLLLPVLVLLYRGGCQGAIYDLCEASLLSFLSFYAFTPQLHTPYLILMMPFLCAMVGGRRLSSIWYSIPIFWSEGFYFFLAQRLSPISTEYSYYTVTRSTLLLVFFSYILIRMLIRKPRDQPTTPIDDTQSFPQPFVLTEEPHWRTSNPHKPSYSRSRFIKEPTSSQRSEKLSAATFQVGTQLKKCTGDH